MKRLNNAFGIGINFSTFIAQLSTVNSLCQCLSSVSYIHDFHHYAFLVSFFYSI